MSSLSPTSFRLSAALVFSAFLVSACSSSDDTETGGSNQNDGSGKEEDSILVNFDIEFPAYVSEELQVRLVWGDKDITARWNGDESWSASADFPADTSNPLVVTYHDRNGDITLCSFKENFRTGIDAMQSFQITADKSTLIAGTATVMAQAISTS